MRELILSCLQKNPKQRINLKELKIQFDQIRKTFG